MARMARSTFRALLTLLIAIQARSALLEMSRTLWTKAVSGGLTKIGKLDPLRVPLIKVDQSEGDTTYRMVLRDLDITGLNESILESVHVARGGAKSNLSERETGYVSYSDLRDVDSIGYKFHTMSRQPGPPRESFETVLSPVNRPSSRYREDRYGGSRQDRYQSGTFERSRQYERPAPTRPFTAASAEHGDPSYRGSPSSASGRFEAGYPEKRPVYYPVQPGYVQRATHFRRPNSQDGKDAVDCEDVDGVHQFGEERKDNRQYGPRQDAADGRYYGQRRVGEAVEVSASETIETRLKNRDDVRPPASYREQLPRTDIAGTSSDRSKDGMKERSDYIDIVYAGDRANGSMRRFGNLGIDSRGNRRVYGIEDVMKEIRQRTRFIIHNFTEGEALMKRNDAIKAAMEAGRMKDLNRYAKSYQEQQGYFEEAMQLIYHYGIDANNGSRNVRFNDTKRMKRAHPEERKTAEDDLMHVILRIRVPLLRVKSQYTLMGKVGKQILHGNGLLVGNFTELVGDFTLELKRINEELIIVQAAKAKLSAKDNKITLQGMGEEGSVRTVLNHGLMAAEAVAAMLADDFATKGFSEKTADPVIYRMYRDLLAN